MYGTPNIFILLDYVLWIMTQGESTKASQKSHLVLIIIIMYQKSHFNMRDSLSRFALKVRDKNVKHLGKLGGNYGRGIEVI